MLMKHDMTEDIMIRLVNKNTLQMNELQKKQESLYTTVAAVDSLVSLLTARVTSLEKEITAMKKTTQVLKEAEFL